jgi:arginyl-tRNA synthetase
MNSLKTLLTGLVSAAFVRSGCESRFGQVVDSARPDLGQFQCNGALAASKAARKNPREIALAVMTILEKDSHIKALSLAGPGFINITLADEFMSRLCSELGADPHLGYTASESSKPKTVIIDFGGPNVAKPMHVGHLRSAIIGDSLQRICRFGGERAIGDNHLGDWGTQMGMLIGELKKRQPDLPYFSDDFSGEYPAQSPVTIAELEEMYPKASAECKNDPAALAEAVEYTAKLQAGHRGYTALWKHFCGISINEMKRDFATLGVNFDHWLGESFYHDRMGQMVQRLAAEGTARRSEGALVIPVGQETDQKEIPPLMLEKSGGGFLYGTSDLATIEYRMEAFGPGEIVYVVDKRQSLHFEQLFRAARITGIAGPNVAFAHVGFGTVNGPDGKPFKTRAGGVMRLKDLFALVNEKALQRMEEAGVAREFGPEEKAVVAQKVGLAALKFADLMNHRESDYLFDIDKFTQFEGKTGPYILYTAVRIKSILRNAADKHLAPGPLLPATDAERDLMLVVAKLPDVIRGSREAYLPNYLCDFAYTLAQEFNRFYRDYHILSEKDAARQASWIALIKLVLAELETILYLLGIETPERM